MQGHGFISKELKKYIYAENMKKNHGSRLGVAC